MLVQGSSAYIPSNTMPPDQIPIAWDPIGVGDTLMGVLLAVVAGAALLWLVFTTDFFMKWPWQRDHYDADYKASRQRHITRGILICDWVDASVLGSVAKQKHVEPDPDRLERGSRVTTSRGLEGGRRIRGRLSRERQRDERSYYEMSKDPNALLGRVMENLHGDSAIDDDLDIVWGTVLLGDDQLDDVVRAARDKPEIEAARDAVRALQSAAVRERVAQSWQSRADKPRFVLVESEWIVERVVDLRPAAAGDVEYYELRLSKLRQRIESYPTEAYDVHEGHFQQLPMPSDLQMTARLPFDRLTEQGKGRVRDKVTIVAGIFGTTAGFKPESGTLTLTPIAVFARVET